MKSEVRKTKKRLRDWIKLRETGRNSGEIFERQSLL